MTAAQLIHDRVAEHLGGATRARTAYFLCMTPQQWGRYLNGQVSPKESQINRWLAMCQADGIDIHPTVASGLSPTVSK